MSICIPIDVLEDIEWWRSTLSSPWCGVKIKPPPPFCDHEVYIDMSSSWGIGFIFNSLWLAWLFWPGTINPDEGRSISWAEFIAIELALHALVHSGLHSVSFLVFSDNQGVIGVFNSGMSKSPTQNATLRRILLLFNEYDISITTTYIPSADNPADGPSCSIFSPLSNLFPYPPKVPTCLYPYVFPSVSHA